MERKTVNLLGFGIDTFDFESALKYALNLIKSKKGGQIVTINPEMIEYGLKNSDFANILNNADLVIPDGVGVKLGLKLKGINVQRIAGIEFSHRLLEEAANNKIYVGFIGARPHIMVRAVQNIQEEFEKLKIVYAQNGYFQDREKVLSELKSKKPELVLVALGSPRQEEFIQDARKLLPHAVMIGVGGSFDVWSGEVQRAPVIYQKLGLEWLYRTVKEPQRFKRIFPALPKFMLKVLFSKK